MINFRSTKKRVITGLALSGVAAAIVAGTVMPGANSGAGSADIWHPATWETVTMTVTNQTNQELKMVGAETVGNDVHWGGRPITLEPGEGSTFDVYGGQPGMTVHYEGATDHATFTLNSHIYYLGESTEDIENPQYNSQSSWSDHQAYDVTPSSISGADGTPSTPFTIRHHQDDQYPCNDSIGCVAPAIPNGG